MCYLNRTHHLLATRDNSPSTLRLHFLIHLASSESAPHGPLCAPTQECPQLTDPLLTSSTGSRCAGACKPIDNTHVFRGARDLGRTATVRLKTSPAPASPTTAPNIQRTEQQPGHLPANSLAFVHRCVARIQRIADSFASRNRRMPTPTKHLLGAAAVLGYRADRVQFSSPHLARCTPTLGTPNPFYAKPRTQCTFTSEAQVHLDLKPRSAELHGPIVSALSRLHSLGGTGNVDLL